MDDLYSLFSDDQINELLSTDLDGLEKEVFSLEDPATTTTTHICRKKQKKSQALTQKQYRQRMKDKVSQTEQIIEKLQNKITELEAKVNEMEFKAHVEKSLRIAYKEELDKAEQIIIILKEQVVLEN